VILVLSQLGFTPYEIHEVYVDGYWLLEHGSTGVVKKPSLRVLCSGAQGRILQGAHHQYQVPKIHGGGLGTVVCRKNKIKRSHITEFICHYSYPR
jgi:hypothetical protein